MICQPVTPPVCSRLPARRVWTRLRLEIRRQRVPHPKGHERDGAEITEIPSMGMSAYPARARQAGQDEGM